jgi:hypothetical protein
MEEINKLLATEMDFLKKSVYMSVTEKETNKK